MKADTEPLTTLPNNSFVQWSADNVDHNLATLDGKETFHGMGIIASVTPSGSIEQLKDVKRLKKRCLVSEVTEHKGVDIVEYYASEYLKKFPQLKSLTSLKVKKRCIFDLQSEAFWHSNCHFSSTLKPRPLWSGFMQQMFRSSNDVHYNKSDVILLPIIDLQPTNLICIYSTLLFIQCQADQLNINTTLVQGTRYNCRQRSQHCVPLRRFPYINAFYWQHQILDERIWPGRSLESIVCRKHSPTLDVSKSILEGSQRICSSPFCITQPFPWWDNFKSATRRKIEDRISIWCILQRRMQHTRWNKRIRSENREVVGREKGGIGPHCTLLRCHPPINEFSYENCI